VEAAVNRFRESVQTVSMFGGRRLVWLKDVNFLADTVTGRAESTLAAVADLQAILAAVNPEEVAVLVTAAPVDRRRSFPKWCEKQAEFQLVGGDGESGAEALAGVLDEASIARAEVVRFVHEVGRNEQGKTEGATQQAVLHAADHIERAIAALRAPVKGASLAEGDPGLVALAQKALEIPKALLESCCDGAPERVPPAAMRAAVARMLEASGGVAAMRRSVRADALRLAAIGVLDPEDAMRRIDGALWIDSLSYHLARAAFDLGHEPAEVLAAAADASRIAPSDEPPQSAR
jgi:hypothetical protein